MHPILTIFCAFTRQWAVDRWLEDLSNVEHDPALTNLVFIIDGDEPYVTKTLARFAEDKQYRSFHPRNNTNWHVNEVNLSIRRHRVAAVHEQAKDLVAKCDGDIVIGLEDDTVFDRMPSFDRLIKPLDRHAIGFVEGVQMGRWGAQIIGAWTADDINNPKQIETLLPPFLRTAAEAEQTQLNDMYEAITGGGWYGYATFKDLFLQAPYFASPSMPWGPDVNYGFWVRQQGYECLIDWSTVFGHDDHGVIKYPDSPDLRLTKIVFRKLDYNGKWEREDHEHAR